MTHVTALAESNAVNHAVYNFGGAPEIRDCKINAKNGTNDYGVYNYDSTVKIYSTTIDASGGGTNDYGIYNTGSGSYAIQVYGSQIYGEDNSVYHNSGVTSKLGACLLYKSGNTSGTGGIGTFKCAQCYDNTYSDLNSTCQ
jgi:hypothetical protein